MRAALQAGRERQVDVALWSTTTRTREESTGVRINYCTTSGKPVEVKVTLRCLERCCGHVPKACATTLGRSRAVLLGLAELPARETTSPWRGAANLVTLM